MTLHPGTLLADRYEIGARLGARADTCTYAAVDRQSGQPVVVKELALSGLEEWKPYDLFEREARVLANLDHPQVPRLVAYFRQEDEEELLLYLVAARVPGRSLAARLEEGWRPQEAEVRAIARRVLAVLVYLQGLQPPVIHRDIKPSNLVMDDASEICLVDFGSVRDAVRPQGGSTVAGTFGYMAPEQFIAKAVPASDLYGLGATLVHLLSGVPPEQIPQRDLRLGFRPLVSCSEVLAAWIERLLEPVAEGRFAGAAEARRVLDQLDAGEMSAEDLLQGPDGTRRPSRREAVSTTMLWLLTGGIGGATIGIMVDRDVSSSIGATLRSLLNFGPIGTGYSGETKPMFARVMSAVMADGTGRAMIGAGAGILLGAIGVLSPRGIVRTVIERVVGIMFGLAAGSLVGAVGGAAVGMLLGLLFGLPLGLSGWVGGPLFGAYFGVIIGAVFGAIGGVVLGATGGVSRIAAILQALFEGEVGRANVITSGRDNT